MSDGIGIANLPNQVRLVALSLFRTNMTALPEAQNRRKARSSFYHHGCWYVIHFLLSRPFSPARKGESGLGKTTLVNTLFSTELSPAKNYNRRHHKQLDKLTEVEIIKAELEEKQFKTKLTVIDTPGFGDYVNNRDSWAPIVDFIDDQHEAYMRQEQQPQRQDKIDLRVHACLYFIRPTGHT